MNNFFSDGFIEEIRMNNEITDVVSEYVRLERKGRYFFGLCPFHNEKTPSFSVTPDMQIFNCFGCNKGGNVIHFIMNIENLDFVEAIKYLAERAGIELPDTDSSKGAEEFRLRNEILSINKFVAQQFHSNLISEKGNVAKVYLKNRDISFSSIRKFGLGYSIPTGNNFYKLLKEKSFSDIAVVKSGLVIKNKSGEYFDRFRNRLMFPIFDIRGNVIAFGGRTLDNSLPKYMNSPETMVYSKSRNLFSLNFAKNSKDLKLIIVEGYFDVITLHQSGIINSVASLGTALTENQGRLLKKYANEVIISFDADTAGQTATLKSMDLLANMGCNVKVLTLPNGKDPDEFIRINGADEFIKLIDKSNNLVEYKVNRLKNNIDISSTDGKIEFIKKTAQVLSRIDSEAELEIYIRKISQQYEISMEAFFSEVLNKRAPEKKIREVKRYSKNKFGLEDNINVSKNNETETENNRYIIYSELLLMAILSLDNNVYKTIKDLFGVNKFSLENQQIAAAVYAKLESGERIVSGELLSLVDSEKAAICSKIINNECIFEDNKKAALDVINRIYMAKLDNRKQEVLKALKDKDNSDNTIKSNLLKELNELVVEIKKNSES